MTTLTISRTNAEDPKIDFKLKFGTGKTITASMSVEQFGLCITGRSEVPVELKLRNVSVEFLEPKSSQRAKTKRLKPN